MGGTIPAYQEYVSVGAVGVSMGQPFDQRSVLLSFPMPDTKQVTTLKCPCVFRIRRCSVFQSGATCGQTLIRNGHTDMPIGPFVEAGLEHLPTIFWARIVIGDGIRCGAKQQNSKYLSYLDSCSPASHRADLNILVSPPRERRDFTGIERETGRRYPVDLQIIGSVLLLR